MTDQTKWGIHEVQTRNKAIKYRRDLVAKAMETVVKLDETGITDLMLQIEAEYERKYGKNKADKVNLTQNGQNSRYFGGQSRYIEDAPDTSPDIKSPVK